MKQFENEQKGFACIPTQNRHIQNILFVTARKVNYEYNKKQHQSAKERQISFVFSNRS